MRRTEVKSLESKSLEYINDPSKWVAWPVVPLIHLTRMDDNSGIGIAGLLFDADHTEGYRVYHLNLYELPMTEERFRALEVTTYPTVIALLKDWRVD